MIINSLLIYNGYKLLHNIDFIKNTLEIALLRMKNHVMIAENQPKSHVKYLTYLCIMKLFKQIILFISILLVLLALSYSMATLLLVYVFPSIN